MANPTGPSPSDAAMTVLIYVDTNKQVGDPNHLKVCANGGRRGNLVHGKFENPVIGWDWNCYRLKESHVGFRFSLITVSRSVVSASASGHIRPSRPRSFITR